MLPTTCLVAAFAAVACRHVTSDLPITAPGAAGDSCRVGREVDDTGLLQLAHEVRSREIADWVPPPTCRQEGDDCKENGRDECCHGFRCDRRGWKNICVKPCLHEGATCHQNDGATGCCNGLECTKQPSGFESKCAIIPQCRQEGHDCEDQGRDECCHGLQCDRRGLKRICVKPCLQNGATCHQNGGASECCNGLECKKQPFGSEGKCATMPQCLQEGHDCHDHGGDECCHGLQCDRRGWKKICVKQCLQVGATCHQNGVAIGCCNGLECTKQPFASESKCATTPPCRQEGSVCQEHGENQCCGGLQCKRKPFDTQSTCVASTPTTPCGYGAHVECPGTPGKMCSGDQCCPAISGSGGTFPCPSASASYSGCQSRNKVANCLL